MKLYHGTSSRYWNDILKFGLRPRKYNKNSNWDQNFESNPECVYLSSLYAPYFAINACDERDNPILIEVDTNLLKQENMRPDEDFLEQSTRRLSADKVDTRFHPGMGKEKNSMQVNTLWFRNNLHLFSDLWELSVKKLGNCCYNGIVPVKAITKVTTWKVDSMLDISVACCDASVSLENKQICGNKYDALTKWLIGEPVSSESILGDLCGIPKYGDKMIKHWNTTLQNRDSWEVIYRKSQSQFQLQSA